MEELLENINVEDLTALPYEELSQWEVGKAVIDTAVNRWEDLDFLEGVEDNKKKEELAVAFDNMAHDILEEDGFVMGIAEKYNFNCFNPEETDESLEFDVMVFPLIRMLVLELDNFNYNKFVDYLDDFSFLSINYENAYDNIDVQAYFVAALGDLIIRSFNNKKEE